ncbi:hypothetical protein PR048_016497 [Dryococelus australis]|uniref:Maturase K n=1 Tax=Dryococelus australis TaxID=614101 RepID=A0ABQ9HJY7_9NEOP|nr:hypothetical protein PR048_016497 [Dryococelus australis]
MIEYIKSLRCYESPLGRGKSVRGYLNPELSIKKLWQITSLISVLETQRRMCDPFVTRLRANSKLQETWLIRLD